MASTRRSTVTLRALEGEPLAHERVREMVIATARAIAERQGVDAEVVEVMPGWITVALDADRIAAVGFAAELRRPTTSWYRHKFGVGTLWGEGPDRAVWLESAGEWRADDDDDAEDEA